MILVLCLASCQLGSKQASQTTIAANETESESSTSATSIEDTKNETTETTTESTTANRVYIVNTNQDALRLRKEPNLDGEVLASLPKGTKVVVEDESDGWSKVTYKGKTGWVKSDFLIEESLADSDDTVEATTKSGGTTSPGYTSTTKDKTTTTKKETTKKETTEHTNVRTPARVTIVFIGRGLTPSMDKTVWPGDSYTVEMARKDIARRFPGEPFKLKGEDIINYDPGHSPHNYKMIAYFGDDMTGPAARNLR